MSIDPQVQTVIDAVAKAEAEGSPQAHEMSPEDARQFYIDTRGAVTPEPPEVAFAADIYVDGPAGPIPMRYYRPAGSAESDILPVMIYFHGGGWVVGNRNTHDVVCRGLANEGCFAVLNVDYRLAPEAKFPAAVEDCFAVVEWALKGAGGLKINPERIAVAGDSAGGTLSTVCAKMALDQGNAVVFQALIYPSTNMNFTTQSQADFGENYLLTKEAQLWYHAQYLNSEADREDWRASPILIEDLSGMPPAYIMTAGYDPLRDEGKAYADRLAEAGVPVIYKCHDGMIHAFITMGKVIDETAVAITEVAQHTKDAFDALDAR
ncbi:MAG: alpha/beta hydrolase [Rhodospirillaceae bacterium]|jgi:acetyl esterase|nr:alpha/beta hydrolase [Rhodospirillaceae bacterium]MBT7265588.1 alpha/beta hydrolase [Rhodospirillaceae bacterium]